MDTDRAEEIPSHPASWREGLSRRNFLRRGTFTAAAVAVASSVPGISSLVATTAADAPALDTGVTDAADEAGPLTEPLIAQVKDAARVRSACSKENERSSSTLPPLPAA
jgi:hypothetical protein